VTDAELERQRRLLHEAFTAGWQAALAVKVTNPGVLAVIESCFELWLEEEVDERGVLGLPFRRRYDLPKPKGSRLSLTRQRPAEPLPPAPVRLPRVPQAAAVPPPAQRTAPASESYDAESRDTDAVRTGS
jgi:hypothetical protein